MTLGFVKLPRRLFTDTLWLKPRVYSAAEAYIYLLMRANFAPGSFLMNRRRICLDIDQLFTSTRALATAWSWQRTTVERFLDYLEAGQYIGRETHCFGTIITIRRDPPPVTGLRRDAPDDGAPKGAEIQWFTEHKSAGAAAVLKKKEREQKKNNKTSVSAKKENPPETPEPDDTTPALSDEETQAYVQHLIETKYPGLRRTG